MEALTGWWDDYLAGSIVVFKIFMASLSLMVIFGLIGAAAKLSNSIIAKKIANAYTIVFRGTPEILVVLLIYFGSAITLTAIAQLFDPSIKYVDVPPFWAGTFAIASVSYTHLTLPTKA